MAADDECASCRRSCSGSAAGGCSTRWGWTPTSVTSTRDTPRSLVLERARRFREERDVSFRDALCATRAGNVFTTHTPVAAGFDRFRPR